MRFSQSLALLRLLKGVITQSLALLRLLKDQQRVIILTCKNGQESQIKHSKFHENRSTGSNEENLGRFLPYTGLAAILVM